MLKREEKNLQSRQKILESALGEFSSRGYGQSSINTICSSGNISKGILYHYFSDKDELYLSCVRICFGELTNALANFESARDQSLGMEEQLQAYFDKRLIFFQEHPLYQRMFCEVIVTPPEHLAVALAKIRSDFDALNLRILDRLLSRVQLRSDVTRAEVLEIFSEYQDFINAKYQNGQVGEIDIAAREKSCRRALGVLLYGVVKRWGVQE